MELACAEFRERISILRMTIVIRATFVAAFAAAVFLAASASGPFGFVAAQSGNLAGGPNATSAATSSATWHFAVAGDSRNCGDVVMPAIATDAKARGARFFWHLGDFRAVYAIDEDFLDTHPAPAEFASAEENAKYMDLYRSLAWEDFIANQLNPFGNLDLRVFLAIGNHELDPANHRTRAEYIAAFRKWLTWPEIAHKPKPASAPGDAPEDEVFPYYHWMMNGIDFITLDNASNEQFSATQLQWFEKVLEQDAQDPGVGTIVVGMHKPLPGSLSEDHSMSESPDVGVPSGRRVYRDLLNAQNVFHKKVYVVASHSHYYMDNVFNTDYWKDNVLPGWIVGTAGAQRYELPPSAKFSHDAIQGMYGYLLATVNPGMATGSATNGSIQFEFEMLHRKDLHDAAGKKFSREVIDRCFDQNKRIPF